MNEFILGAFISLGLVVISTAIYYEVLRLTWKFLPAMHVAPRRSVIVIMIAIFFGHTMAVWVYGAVYWFLSQHSGLGGLSGEVDGSFFSYVYYSAATYSSLGLGDMFPSGILRLINGVEVLNGLVLIGWSVSFTYLAMEKFWDLH